MIYGAVVDLTCVHWDALPSHDTDIVGSSEPATHQGACRAYQNDSFRYYLHGVTMLVMLLAFIVDCLITRRAAEVDFYDDNYEDDDFKTDVRLQLKKSTETI